LKNYFRIFCFIFRNGYSPWSKEFYLFSGKIGNTDFHAVDGQDPVFLFAVPVIQDMKVNTLCGLQTRKLPPVLPKGE